MVSKQYLFQILCVVALRSGHNTHFMQQEHQSECGDYFQFGVFKFHHCEQRAGSRQCGKREFE